MISHTQKLSRIDRLKTFFLHYTIMDWQRRQISLNVVLLLHCVKTIVVAEISHYFTSSYLISAFVVDYFIGAYVTSINFLFCFEFHNRLRNCSKLFYTLCKFYRVNEVSRSLHFDFLVLVYRVTHLIEDIHCKFFKCLRY